MITYPQSIMGVKYLFTIGVATTEQIRDVKVRILRPRQRKPKNKSVLLYSWGGSHGVWLFIGHLEDLWELLHVL